MLWQHNLSARSNQDIQRAYEEHIIKEMAVILNRKTLNDTMSRNPRTIGRNCTPLGKFQFQLLVCTFIPDIFIGGLWMRLETEWRESLSQREIQSRSRHMTAKLPNKPRSRF